MQFEQAFLDLFFDALLEHVGLADVGFHAAILLGAGGLAGRPEAKARLSGCEESVVVAELISGPHFAALGWRNQAERLFLAQGPDLVSPKHWNDVPGCRHVAHTLVVAGND